MPEAPLECDCDGNCPRCRIRRGEADESEIKDSRRLVCMVCGCKLSFPGGYYGMGMCGPCVTGDSDTLAEQGTHW